MECLKSLIFQCVLPPQCGTISGSGGGCLCPVRCTFKSLLLSMLLLLEYGYDG